MSSMVNLLPSTVKDDIVYGRRNTKLLWWCIGGMCVVVMLAITVVLGGMYIDRAKASLQSDVETAKKNISSQQLDSVKSEADNLSEGVKLLARLLSSEVLFSKLLKEIGTLMPKDTILGDLALSSKVNGPLEITSYSINSDGAAQIKTNLSAKDNVLFDKVDLISVTCDDSTVGRYKCTVILKALFKADAAVSFTSSAEKAEASGGSQ